MIGKLVLAGGILAFAVAIMGHASESILAASPFVGGIGSLIFGGLYGWFAGGGVAAVAVAGGMTGGGTALAGIALGIALGDQPLATLAGVGGGTLFGAVGASVGRIWRPKAQV
jgi:hypothetical protein